LEIQKRSAWIIEQRNSIANRFTIHYWWA